MNYIVPEFEAVDDDYSIPELHTKSTMGGNEDFKELLWRNGQVVMQSQNQSQRSKKSENEIKSAIIEDESGPSDLFMKEDEMASWLHYPVDNNNTLLDSYLYNNNNDNDNDNNNDNDYLYPTPVSATPVAAAAAVTTSSTPPPPPSVKISSLKRPVPSDKHVEESGQPKVTKFGHFSRPGKRRSLEPDQASLSNTVSTSKVVTIVVTPSLEVPASRVSCNSEKLTQLNVRDIESASGPSIKEKEKERREISVTSSHDTGGLGESTGIEPSTQKSSVPTDDRKCKSRVTDDIEGHNEDIEFMYPDEKKQSHGGSTSTKRSRSRSRSRSRTAEIHYLSERKRRDRINDKMKELQDLIPRCNKSDKASMLDEAIDYLKSLQTQVQMMSMGYGMGPACQTANMSAPMMTSFPLSTQNQPPVPSFADPFQQYLGFQHTQQVPLNQGLGGMPPVAAKASSSSNKDAPNPDVH